MEGKEKHTKHLKKDGGTSKKKTVAFKIAAVLFPFLLLFLLEMGLRLAGYGSDFPVFIAAGNHPGYLVMNPNVSRKYFFSAGNATTGYQEQFKKNKDPNTIRIFVLGASTGIGYPYFKNGSFHRWLQYGLNETFPNKKLEIINLSLTAINSYTLLDFIGAIIKNKPDAVLIYAGHNEYYGALGVGAVNSLGKYPRLVNLVLKLRELRIIQGASNIYNSVKKLFSNGSEKPETLMKRMVANQAIPYGSAIYQDGINQFKFNMNALLFRLNKYHIPTFISTLVSNEKNLKPFISDSSSQEKSAAYHYTLAKKEYREGQFDRAKKDFEQAKELDMLRFRAPKKINATIKTLANTYRNTYLVDTKKRFDEASPHGIPGNELLMEHVHPNLRGYSLLAYGFYQSLKAHHPFGLQWKDTLTLATLEKQMPITKVDSLQGAYEVEMLKRGWPYYEKNKTFKKPSTIPEKIAGRLALKEITWEAAMETLFQYYEKKQTMEKALKVLEAFSLEHPDNANSYLKTATLALQLKKYSKADRLFTKSFQLKKSTPTARQIAIKLIRAGHFGPAIPYLDFITTHEPKDYVSQRLRKLVAIILNTQEPVMSKALKIEKLLQLAKVYMAVGETNKAAGYIDQALKIDPSNTEAKLLSKKIHS